MKTYNVKTVSGWSLSTISRGKTHYYKDGVSLCGKRKVDLSNRNFDSKRMGNIYFHDCGICIKKEMEILKQSL
jgi:hypothetical protein